MVLSNNVFMMLLSTLWASRCCAFSSRDITSQIMISGRRRCFCFNTRCNVPKEKIPLHRYLPVHLLSSSNSSEASDTTALTAQVIPGTTIQTALTVAVKTLEKNLVPEPEESALHLLSHSLDLSWGNGHRELREVIRLPSSSSTMIKEPSSSTQKLAQRQMSEDQCNTFQALLQRRIHLEPLQYIVGQWDFHDLVGLQIKKPLLCPRPETEELVEFVLKEVSQLIQSKGATRERIRILDVGCGTGAIGLAIANKYVDQVQVVALDVLPEAVELSNDNAKKFLTHYIVEKGGNELNTNYNAILCSAEDFTNSENAQTYNMDFDIVVSNPPYIPSNDMASLSTDVIGYESYKALCGGDDGLDIIRQIVHRLPEWTNGSCWLEVDDSHPSLISAWLSAGSQESKRFGVEYVATFKDFCGRDRFVKLRVL